MLFKLEGKVSLILIGVLLFGFVEDSFGAEKVPSEQLHKKIYILKYTLPALVKEKLEESLPAQEGRKILVDEKANVLIITDTLSNHKLISKLVEKLDKPKQQFLIKFIKIFLPTKEKQGWGGSQGESRIVALEGITAKITLEGDIWSFCYEVTPILKEDGKISLNINYEIKQEGKPPIRGYFPNFIFKNKEIKLLNTFIAPGCEKEGIKGEMACGILIYVEKIEPSELK